MVERINRFSDVTASEDSIIVVSIERRKRGKGRLRVVVNFDATDVEFRGVRLEFANPSEEPSRN